MNTDIKAKLDALQAELDDCSDDTLHPDPDIALAAHEHCIALQREIDDLAELQAALDDLPA